MSQWHYGDIVWADLDPSAGHEQRKRSPLVVVSNDQYNQFNNLVMCVPITSDSTYPLHLDIGAIPSEDGRVITGYAAIEQAKSLDLQARHARRVASFDGSSLDRVAELMLGGLMQPTMRITRFV
ncbi:type II toxin-antitoxin system PemK/MazF family toxin [Bifidobacterium aquikefiricola]|uniref:Type II toxin-antitoxin system PemK/MazF family toxin n=1 Tax=Bifidobacterium aquikefiricola TaxID=3059038 RepID=A0AB39U7J9_9BIFI